MKMYYEVKPMVALLIKNLRAYCLWLNAYIAEGRRKKEEGRRKKEEGEKEKSYFWVVSD
ncbi:MAG: hypothetical protein F6K24_30165 [Okeania sp. SIO2D1]|nr:hypothetical protein [Okeania sp. SIO2D1]